MLINELKNTIKGILESDKHIPAMIWSGPGIGKSSAVRQSAEELGYGFIDLRLSQFNPVDLRGLPVVDRENKSAEWFPPESLPTERLIESMDKGKKVMKTAVFANGEQVADKGVLFLDEINLAPAATMAAGYQLVLDRRVGEYSLPKGWKVIAAGNRSEDQANVTKFPAPLANRFIHLELSPDSKQWIKWGVSSGIHEHILAFIGKFPQHLYELPKNNEKTFPSPRSWAQASNLYSLRLPIDSAVGEGVSGVFRGWIKVFDRMPDIDDILAGKETKVPKEIDVLWALCMALISRADEKNVSRVVSYVYQKAMPIELQVVTLTSLSDKSEKIDLALTKSKGYADWCWENKEFIGETLNISIKDRKDLGSEE